MCGRYALVPDEKFYDRFDVVGTSRDLSLQPRYNIAPGQTLPVITRNSPNKVVLMSWGLIPFWAKDPKIAYRTINAKAETVAVKPAFRSSFKSKRCLIPASGFYEWKKLDSKRKQPFYFQLKNGEVFSFAGLYDVWKNEKGVDLQTYTIITTTANEFLREVHERMPIILERKDEDIWLDSQNPVEKLQQLLKPFPAEKMACHPVSSLVNDAAIDEQSLINSL